MRKNDGGSNLQPNWQQLATRDATPLVLSRCRRRRCSIHLVALGAEVAWIESSRGRTRGNHEMRQWKVRPGVGFQCFSNDVYGVLCRLERFSL